MVLPIGTARGTTVRRTTSLTLLGALAIMLALPTFAFASPVSAPVSMAAPLHGGPAAHDGTVVLNRAIGALAHGEGPAFGSHLQCSASTATTAHCGGSPAALRS
ncbi:MAG: hypothetical protein L3J73_05660, partial [Thermoplasmata archaeon]|nr:hypothetical protein [Thermoplasmata archaeon]